MVKDVDAEVKMITTALELLKDNDRKTVLSAQIKSLGKPKATEDIVNELMELVA